MPEYLTIDGYPIPVREGSEGRGEPERSGEKVRMYDNSLASSENPTQRKNVWTFATPPMTYAELRPIIAVLELNVARQAAGYAITRGLAALQQVVTVNGAGAAAGATTIPVAALAYPIPKGRVLTFTGAKVVTLTASAMVGATALTTTAVPAGGLAAGDTATDTVQAADPASVTVLTELGPRPNLPLGDADVQYALTFKLLEQ